MEDQNQKPEAAPFVEFDGEEAKQAYLRVYAPKGIESLDMWERACIECGLIPPATIEAFRAGVDQYPQLEAWRQEYMAREMLAQLAEVFKPAKKPSVVRRFFNMLFGRKPAQGLKVSIERISPEEMEALLADLDKCKCGKCAQASDEQPAAASA